MRLMEQGAHIHRMPAITLAHAPTLDFTNDIESKLGVN